MAEMAQESYFDLPVSDQADVLQSLAPVMGRRAEILEKDIWLCQVLDILFQLPCRKAIGLQGRHLAVPSHRILPNTSPTSHCRPRRYPCYLRRAPSGRRLR